MPTRHLTRREAVGLGAGAAALVVLRHPAVALARRPDAFEMILPDRAGATAAGGWRTLPVARAPRRFHLVGLRWGTGAVREVQVRSRRLRGDWSAWAALPVHGDHAPDRQAPRRATDPAWCGASDLVQFRVRGGASGLRARFVVVPAMARTSRRPKAQAGQRGAPPIVARSAWGGDSRPPKAPPESGEVQLAFVHHTVSTNDYAPEDSASIVLAICRYHQDHNRWNDIGYNFLVDKYGQIFEGRAGGIEQAIIGAQAQGYNSVSTGIATLGDFSTLPYAEAGLESLARLIAWKLPLHGVPVTGQVTVSSAGGAANRYPAGTAVTLHRISGHRDGNKTACPGAALYGQLQGVRDRAAQLAVPLSALSARVAASRVRHPAPLALSGTLRFSDGSTAAGAPVRIEHQSNGAAWQVIASTAAAADGTWKASARPPGSGQVRAVFSGDGSHPALESAPIAVRVLPRVRLALATRRSPPGAKVQVTGKVEPTWPSRVALVLEIKRGGRWRPVQHKRINVRGGAFASFVRPASTGLYRISIEAPGAVARRQLRVTSLTGGASAG